MERRSDERECIRSFFDVMERDAKLLNIVRKRIDGGGVSAMVKTIRKEVAAAKKLLKMDMGSVTPDFLCDFDLQVDVTAPLAKITPVFHELLQAATESVRKRKKDVLSVSPFPTLAFLILKQLS